VYRLTAHILARRFAIVLIPVSTSDANTPADQNSFNANPEYFLMKHEMMPMKIPITDIIHSMINAKGASKPKETTKHPGSLSKLENVSATDRPNES